MTAEQVALGHYRTRRALANGTSVAARRLWEQVDQARIVASWRLLIPQMLVVLTGAQLAAAWASEVYVSDVLAEQDIDPGAAGRVVPESFAGAASDGRDLRDLLASPAFTALSSIGAGASPRLGLAAGLAALDMMVRTQVADAGRTADQVALTARPQATGYVRMMIGTSCSRCAILAGRRYGWSAGFQRHPRLPLRLHPCPCP